MRLAIVEDDDKVRQQLQTYVLQYFQGRENDVEIRLFADGDEILEDYAADYDLIFLDIQMKRLDGLATAERIRERDEDVYLVFITNLANYAIRGYAVHALDFILKPVNFLMLRQVPRPSSSRSLVTTWPAASATRWLPAAPSSSRRTAMT